MSTKSTPKERESGVTMRDRVAGAKRNVLNPFATADQIEFTCRVIDQLATELEQAHRDCERLDGTRLKLEHELADVGAKMEIAQRNERTAQAQIPLLERQLIEIRANLGVLFEVLDETELTESGREFHPAYIQTSRVSHRLKLEPVMKKLKEEAGE